MSIERAGVFRSRWGFLAAALATGAWAAWCSPGRAQVGFGFVQAVGGVYVDARGVVKNVERDQFRKLKEMRLHEMQPIADDLGQPAELRKISLKQMQAALAEALAEGKGIPDEVRYLGGIQRIQYVFVYPEMNDIVLAGFGEAWQVDERGNMIGKTTGRPVIEFDDFLVALRTAEPAAQSGITCSIDPTKEGLKRLQNFLLTVPLVDPDPQYVMRGYERELGPQTVTIRGVPKTSHFAAVLLAADYRMKRIGMAFEKPPVKGMKSYLDMIKGNAAAAAANVLPRWWLAPNYEALLTDEDGLAWELRGQGIKTMTEDEIVAASGERTATGTSNPQAQKWAETMTAKYDELSIKEPIFGELRNCMDLAVIAALIVKENLAAKADCDLSLLFDSSRVPLRQALQIPRELPTQASRSGLVFAASGGVLVNSWGTADKKEQTAELSAVRSKAGEGRSDGWWWN